ncbi:DUF2255 family protein [Bacillus safensis]|uniref:DUF2255 family protein n=1 Tax=Bacillus safensis TaxID=561879 RepID=UPI000469EB7F|nr:DUF2255 family protein [Bacillus safensis]
MQINWSPDQISTFSAADDLYISPFYSDGKTPGTPTWIWSVTVDGNLYVRAYNGQHSTWFQSAIKQEQGKIKIAGNEYNVTFQHVTHGSVLNKKIDQAYKRKYSSSKYLSHMLREGPISATVKIKPL